jgi:predicted nucleotidyltransferase
MTNIKLNVLEYLKFERDERIPELIEMYDGDIQYVIDEIWGPLETCLDGKTDEDLVNMINEIMDDKDYESNFKEWREWNSGETDLDTLHCTLVWENITNP